MNVKVVYLVLVIYMYIFRGGAQTLSCDSNISQPLCPGTVTKCNCTVTGTTSSTRWLFITLNQCPSSSNFIALVQTAPCAPPSSSSSGTCGPYLSMANNNPIGSSCPTSTLNITANPSLNGLVIECRDISSGLPGTLFGTGNISIVAPPSAPTITSLIINYPNITVTWTSVPTATSYNVSINSSSSTPVTITSSGPLQNTFTGLTNNTVYTVSVVAINCAGNSSAAKIISPPIPPPTPSPSSSSPGAESTAMLPSVGLFSIPVSTIPTATTTAPTNGPSQTSSSSATAVGIGVGVSLGITALLAAAIAVVVVVIVVHRRGPPASPMHIDAKEEVNEIPLPPKNSSTVPKSEGMIYADIGLPKRLPLQAPAHTEETTVTYSTVQTAWNT